MSYEKGDKFVLEIDEVIEVEGVKNRYYRCKNSEIIFNEHELKRLIGISETPEETYNRGYYDGSHKGFSLTKDEIENARDEGAEEAWEFRNMALFNSKSEEFRWYSTYHKSISEMTYAEAKAEFEKWEAGPKWEPKAGDGVSCYGEKGILLEIIGDSAYVMWKNEGCGYCELKDMSPTGEYVDVSPIFEVLK